MAEDSCGPDSSGPDSVLGKLRQNSSGLNTSEKNEKDSEKADESSEKNDDIAEDFDDFQYQDFGDFEYGDDESNNYEDYEGNYESQKCGDDAAGRFKFMALVDSLCLYPLIMRLSHDTPGISCTKYFPLYNFHKQDKKDEETYCAPKSSRKERMGNLTYATAIKNSNKEINDIQQRKHILNCMRCLLAVEGKGFNFPFFDAKRNFIKEYLHKIINSDNL